MSARGVLRIQEGHRLAFFCPGCREVHSVQVAPNAYRWDFNGDYDLPTFSPSILVGGFEMPTEEEVIRIMNKEEVERRPRVCHSYVIGGEIRYLSDCTHSLAGKNVKLEPF